MRGSIRMALGFLMAFGAVGGIETGSPLLATTALAIAGLLVMTSGVSAMNSVPAGLE